MAAPGNKLKRKNKMLLQSAKNLRVLSNNEKIPKNSVCYGLLSDGSVNWVKPGKLAGKQWKKYSLNSPSVIVTEDNK